jgi:hypothetical protein
VSSEDKQIKVTDKRMFLPDGELREEYRFLNEKSTAAPPPAAPTSPEPAPDLPRPVAAQDSAPFRSEMHEMDDLDGEEQPPLEMPDMPPGLGPTFYDLVAMLAEPVPIYLGDVELPDGQSAENLEMAGLHIDLLDVLRQKTAGNLTAQENAFLEDLLYRMRVRYVQKTR